MKMSIRYLVLASILLLPYDHATASKVVLGGFFDKDASWRNAFSLAVRTINGCRYDPEVCEQLHTSEGDDDIDPRLFHQVEFAAMAVNVDDDDLMAIYKKFGEIAGTSGSRDNRAFSHLPSNEYGLSTVIGPHGRVSLPFMQGVCDSHDIPHIVVTHAAEPQRNPVRTITLYPDATTLATVYVQLIEKMEWGSFSILYQKTENLIALQNVLKMYEPFTHEIYSYRLGSGPNFSEPLLIAKRSRLKSFLLDCDSEILSDVMRQLQELGMMSDAYKYLVTSLDFQTIDLWPFRHTGANISGLRIVDPDSPFVSEFVGAHLEDFDIDSVDELSVHDALMFDAVALFAQGYKDFAYKNPIRAGGNRAHQYYGHPRPWAHGLSLRNYILYSEMNGLTGPVMLDSDGARRRFKLDFMNLRQTGLAKVGTWDPEQGFDDLEKLTTEVSIEHFKVLITMNPPYAQRVNNSYRLEGNDRYEGFVVDIIKRLAKEMNFNYTFFVQEDSNNGNCSKSPLTDQCVCSGMMGKLLDREMDIAITDLTITENRAQCIQFSTAFWNLGMSILYKKAQKAEATWYSFFLPFKYTVWINLFLAWIFASLMFYAFGRLSPPEWNNPYPCIDEPTELENQFSIDNAFWFTMGSMVQQGSELAPIGSATRCLAGSWWFFCLIMTNTYTANLAAFLTVETPVKTVNSIEDLYNQTAVKFGAKKGGSTFTYFQSSSDPKHRELYKIMTDPEWQKKYMVPTNDDGIEMARSKEIDYAFLTESSTIEYVQYRKCDLEQAGGLIDTKAYAIGFAKGFKYIKEIDKKISWLNENSVVKDLYKKWWTEKGAVCGDKASNTPKPMNLEQLVGIFYVLTGGIMVSFVLTSYEFLRAVQATARSEKASFRETLIAELRNIAGSKSVKPVLKKHRSSDTNCSDSMSFDLTMTTKA